MSVRSLKTAVTCAKPLREKERVVSSPGVPARAVSIGKVTCFSISIGVSAGAMALIWTWTLVTSGTASIGSLVNDHAPRTAAAPVTKRTSQRRWTEKTRMRSIMALVLGQALQELGLEREGVGRCNDFAGLEAGHDLDKAIVASAERDRAFLQPFRHADENDLVGADGLDGGYWYGKW